jgi:DNA-binding response OmpR family regulator
MRVLVAEDARALADRVAEGLRDQGMAVDIARDGLEAAAKLDINAYDVVLLDRDLPGIELDPATRMATRDGRTLDLSVKEFAVLEALLHASPAFLSAEDLLETAWDENADPFTTTVTATISRLRRKLGEPPVITTTPGVGYRISGEAH